MEAGGHQTADNTGKSSTPIDAKVSNDRLYNLARDVGETHDLASENPQKAQELRSAWQAWEKELARPLWGPGSTRAAGAREAAAGK